MHVGDPPDMGPPVGYALMTSWSKEPGSFSSCTSIRMILPHVEFRHLKVCPRSLSSKEYILPQLQRMSVTEPPSVNGGMAVPLT